MDNKESGQGMKHTLTRHAKRDRIDRLSLLADTIGIGEELYAFPHPTKPDRRMVYTSTGVLLIVSKDGNRLITAYIPSIDQVTATFRSNGWQNIPPRLYKAVQEAQRYK